MRIDWRFHRLDEGDADDLDRPECLLEFSGRLFMNEERAGLVTGYYVYADPVASTLSFMELWDTDARTCELFEELQEPEWGEMGLRDPLPELLEEQPGILCVETLLLWPQFRAVGLGRKLMEETVRHCADERIGAVVLKADPLQFMRVEQWSDAPESQDESVLAGLPRTTRQQGRRSLREHFGSWNMQRVTGTRYMTASPRTLCDKLAPSWPPCVVKELGNTCWICDGLIDFEHDDWEDTDPGVVHARCRTDDTPL